MKKAALLAGLLVLSISIGGCLGAVTSSSEKTEPGQLNQLKEEITEITLWTYSVGNWGNPTTVAGLLGSFHRHYPNIHVTVEYLDYENASGDQRISDALALGEAPDLVFEGPERLVANWGSQGVMVDLTDLWSEAPSEEIYESVRYASRHKNGAYYIYPVCMGTHCMAINYDLFKAADALQYIDEENHTWSTEGFIQAVQALRAYGQQEVGAVYCKGQGGDQGTRALVNNLYSGTFTDESHSWYTAGSEENIRALQLLQNMEGIHFADDMEGGDEIRQFCSGELAMAFCWNVSLEIRQIIANPNLNFEIFPIAFPTDSGKPKLQGGIWGFGIFDNGDEKRIEAAKTFIRFMTQKDAYYSKAVQTSGYWPVRSMENIYANDELMMEYNIFTQYMGDYYQITPGWAQARTAWWNMLQKIGKGENVQDAINEFAIKANQAAKEAS